MNIRKILMSTGAVVATIGLALPASAQTITNITDTSVDVASDLTTSVNVGGSVHTNSTSSGQSGNGVSGSGDVQVSGTANTSGGGTNGSTGNGFGANIRAMLSSLINGSNSTTDDNGAQGTGSASTNGNVGIGSEVSSALETILVTRADIQSDTTSRVPNAAAAVNNSTELRGFIASQLEADENFEGAEVSRGAVEVTYKQKARLFAFIPVTVDATAKVDANGDVRVSYPWYSWLLSKNKAALESKIEARIQALVGAMADLSAAVESTSSASAGANGVAVDSNTQASMDAAARVTSRAQAMLVAEVKAAMAEALAEAEAATNAEASVNANANANGSASVQ